MWISKKKMRDLEAQIELIKYGLWKRVRELEARLVILEAKEQKRNTAVSNQHKEESGTVRENLRAARKASGLTQQQVAEHLHTAERYYKQIEYGERLGSIEIWDRLEDLFNVPQRKLREISENHHDRANNQ